MSRVERIGDATLYLGDCREILPTLGKVDAVVTDPPYGMNLDTDSRRFTGGSVTRGEGKYWEPIIGDKSTPDLSFLPDCAEKIVFGYNHLAAQLGRGSCLVWIKQNPWSWGTFLSDAELAWKSTGHGVYCLQHTVKGTDYVNRGIPKWHPTEKPVEVMSWCLSFTKGDVTLDPFMGSGTTGVACAKLGRKFIGIEIHEPYFDIACRRIDDAYKQADLFVERPAPSPAEQVDLLGEKR